MHTGRRYAEVLLLIGISKNMKHRAPVRINDNPQRVIGAVMTTSSCAVGHFSHSHSLELRKRLRASYCTFFLEVCEAALSHP